MGFQLEDYNELQEGDSSNANWELSSSCETETSIPSNFSHHVTYHSMKISPDSELTRSRQPGSYLVMYEKEYDLDVNLKIEPREYSLLPIDDCRNQCIDSRIIAPFHDDWPHW